MQDKDFSLVLSHASHSKLFGTYVYKFNMIQNTSNEILKQKRLLNKIGEISFRAGYSDQIQFNYGNIEY